MNRRTRMIAPGGLGGQRLVPRNADYPADKLVGGSCCRSLAVIHDITRPLI